MTFSLSRIATGLLIVIIGALFLLQNLGFTQVGEFIRIWWPLVIVAGGVIIFLEDRKSYLWALLVIFLGVFFQLRQFEFISINPWQLFWPIVIIIVGISILINRAHPRQEKEHKNESDITAILSSSEQSNHSQDLRGAKVTAVLGSAQIDLRKASVKKEAIIEVLSLMGNVEIIVPKNVVIRNQLTHILGGSEQKTAPGAKADQPVLVIVGDVILGAVEIRD